MTDSSRPWLDPSPARHAVDGPEPADPPQAEVPPADVAPADATTPWIPRPGDAVPPAALRGTVTRAPASQPAVPPPVVPQPAVSRSAATRAVVPRVAVPPDTAADATTPYVPRPVSPLPWVDPAPEEAAHPPPSGGPSTRPLPRVTDTGAQAAVPTPRASVPFGVVTDTGAGALFTPNPQPDPDSEPGRVPSPRPRPGPVSSTGSQQPRPPRSQPGPVSTTGAQPVRPPRPQPGPVSSTGSQQLRPPRPRRDDPTGRDHTVPHRTGPSTVPPPSAPTPGGGPRDAPRHARPDTGPQQAPALSVAPPRPPAPPSPAQDRKLTGRVPSGDSAVRRAARAVREVVTTSAATRELAELVTRVQAPVTTGRRIAVTSVAGGAGRTTLTALLGGVFAARRADHVLAVDDDPDGAGPAWRLGLDADPDPRATVARLLAARGGTLADVDAVLSATASGLRVLTGAGPGTAQVVEGLSRFFAVAVVDRPRVGSAQDFAHATVLACPFTPAGLRATTAALDRGAVRADVVALVVTGRTGRSAVRAADVRELERFGAAVVTVPHDRHLAAGTRIEQARLGRATVLAVTRLAGIALERAGR